MINDRRTEATTFASQALSLSLSLSFSLFLDDAAFLVLFFPHYFHLIFLFLFRIRSQAPLKSNPRGFITPGFWFEAVTITDIYPRSFFLSNALVDRGILPSKV
jgi:hypothetical protein